MSMRSSTEVSTERAEQERTGPAGRHSGVIERFVDLAVRRASRADEHVAELRRSHPGATPAELVTLLEKRYLRRAALLGGAVGATATVPGVGTVTALGLTTVQTVAFLSASANHVMGLASIHGVRVDDVERRRTLLLAALLGEEGAEAVSSQLGLGTLYWAKAAITKLPLGTVRAVNRAIRHRLVRWGAARGGALVLGRLAPFGIGAMIGYVGTRAMAKNVIEGTEALFGPAPAAFAEAR
jgi:hypothetical protein